MPEPRAAPGALMGAAPLELAVDARDLARDGRGIGTYARALLTRYAQRDDVRLTLLVRGLLPQRAGAGLRAAIGAPPAHRVRCANRVPPNTDVVWHPWNGTFFGGPAAAVATVHDLVPFAFPADDLERRASQQAPIVRSVVTARKIVCDSHFTAGELRRLLGVAAERTSVVELGVDPIFRPGPLDALPPELRGRRYLLYVGAHDAHKNVATLAQAHRAAFPAGDMSLVFTRPNPLVPEALVCPADPAALVALYRGAALVAVPSLYEGFGLPLLEALACGAPVVASRAASLPEVGGDVAAYIDAPRDPAAWTRELVRLCGAAGAGDRARMVSAGPLRAAAFTWERCAQRTLDVLRAAAPRRPAT